MSQEGQGEVPTNAASNREGGRASNTRLHTITLDDLHRILGLGRSTLIPEAGEDEDEEDEEDEDYSYSMEPNWDRSRDWYPKVIEPKKEGLLLLMNGEFGRLQHQIKSRTKDNNIAKLLLNRGTRPRPTPKEDLASVSYFNHTPEFQAHHILGCPAEYEWYFSSLVPSQRICRAVLIRSVYRLIREGALLTYRYS